MTRRGRILAGVGVLVAVQLAALGVYRAVERRRTAATPAAPFVAQRLPGTEQAPAIVGARADGTSVALAWPAPRPRLVHFWASWCLPCTRELPGLLALARALAGRVDVVAIAVDDEWSEIAAFFGGPVPPEVVIEAAGEAHKRFGVATLPDSYLVDAAGRIVERYDGERDWRSAAARAHLEAATAR